MGRGGYGQNNEIVNRNQKSIKIEPVHEIYGTICIYRLQTFCKVINIAN